MNIIIENIFLEGLVLKINNRIVTIQDYHFKKIEDVKKEVLASGKNIYDFGIGDPDLPVNPNIVESLSKALKKEGFNKYPPYEGTEELKFKIVQYYQEVFNIKLNLDEVIVLIGSKEGIAHLFPAVCDICDHAIIPQPAYPVYETCCRLWGIIPYKMPLIHERDYLPRLELIPESIVKVSKLMLLNYPNNPTGAVLNKEFVQEVKSFCLKNNIVLCNDGAYNEIVKEDNSISILSGGLENCIEFGTFSKTFNMTGFRIGYAVGDKNVIRALLKVKSNMDSGQFMPIQQAAVEALDIGREYIEDNRRIYNERRVCLENILDEKHIDYFKGKGTFYVWCKIPKGYTTDEFCEELLLKYGIVVTPGYVFGKLGYGYFRVALTKSCEVIQEAFSKIEI